MNKRKVVFLTGTRADFGKIKSLINKLYKNNNFEVHIFVTGMHMNKKYGKTVIEIEKCGYSNIYTYINHEVYDTMDIVLSKTIDGFSHYIKELEPDLILVHGDRVETLAGAIVGSLNNILVAHIEGGEVSGTIDELLRHSVSKLSHIHFVSNEEAKRRLIQMGEVDSTIFNIGSPDLDVMFSNTLPTLDEVKKHYNIDFDEYAILMFHPVTTEIDQLEENIKIIVDSVIEIDKNFIVIFPNNDMGSDIILKEYERFDGNDKIKVFPSLRFECFLRLLKEANFILGNSSAGVREAPYYSTLSLNIGTRQNLRVTENSQSIINCNVLKIEIVNAVEKLNSIQLDLEKIPDFGHGNSKDMFFDILMGQSLWKTSKQKYFNDIKWSE